MTQPTADRLRRAYLAARDALLAERSPGGHWVGELSTSALSTAVACGALALVQKADLGSFAPLIDGGLAWLAAHQNADGGWGDTVRSSSNVSTTMLCRAAFHLCGAAQRSREPLARCEAWLGERYGRTPEQLAEAIRRRYGKDRTFSVPILMTSALAGLVAWREVPPLPFELACLPQSWYRFVGLPVVSYALPALIAIGQAVRHHRGSWNPLRRMAVGPSLGVLSRIQPSNGGFLEAAPLTAFVAMGLASTGKAGHPVVTKCVEFLKASVRPDGSWPIDTDLSTWVTTLSVNALAAAGDLASLDRKEELLSWLLAQQYKERHPFTGADPGAWAWTPLPGGVPDADDTPGALLALANLVPELLEPHDPRAPRDERRDRTLGAVLRGIVWLKNLQNRDRGWPTFCRGWGNLPFDRSGSDLTAHALRALKVWEARGGHPLVWDGFSDTRAAENRGLEYLARQQRRDGSWLPLWFGNQHAPDDENPTYGTSRVLAAYRDLGRLETEQARRGVAWLVANQNDDGGWGGGRGTPSSTEETSLAVEVLLGVGEAKAAAGRGLGWLVERVESGAWREATPIGFYFAKLWYFERLYPLAFAVAALGRGVADRR